jgi:hypothetical protein
MKVLAPVEIDPGGDSPTIPTPASPAEVANCNPMFNCFFNTMSLSKVLYRLLVE